MTVQFYVETIYLLDEPVYDMPAGTIVARAGDANWYRYRSWGEGAADLRNKWTQESKNWPRPGPKGIQLFRDYWSYIDNEDHDAPRTVALAAAPKTKLRGL